jgi:hypothetical protein
MLRGNGLYRIAVVCPNESSLLPNLNTGCTILPAFLSLLPIIDDPKEDVLSCLKEPAEPCYDHRHSTAQAEGTLKVAMLTPAHC